MRTATRLLATLSHFACVCRYDVLTVDCVESVVFIAPDADNLGRHWAVVDTDHCPWHELYADDDFGDAIRVQPYQPLMMQVGHNVGNKRKRPGAQSSGAGAGADSNDSASEEHEDTSSCDSDSSASDSDTEAGAGVDVNDPVYQGLYHVL